MEPRRLRRSRRNRWLVGVCGGLGERYGFPPLILRLALIAATFFTLIVPLAYLLAWLVIPEEPEELEPWPPNQGEEEGDYGTGAAGEQSPVETQLPGQTTAEQGEISDPWARTTIEGRSSIEPGLGWAASATPTLGFESRE